MRDPLCVINMIKQIALLIFYILFFTQCSSDLNKTEDNLDSNIPKEIATFESISDNLSPETQEFSINPNKDTLLKCEKGTMLFFEGNSLVLEDGNTPQGTVKIEIQEFYSMKDFISEDLSTVSDSSLLISGGMINISVTNNGIECMLKENKAFAIYFPKKEKASFPMQSFYATSPDKANINWKLIPEKLDTTDSNEKQNRSNDSLLTCEFGIDPFYGFSYDPESSPVDSKPLADLWEYVDANFIPTTQMTKEFCENQELFVSIAVELDKSGKISSAKMFGNSYGHGEYIETFFNSIDTTFGERKENSNMTALFHFNSRTVSSVSNFNYGFNEKYSEFRNTAITKVDMSELNYYILNSISFGLINCDYFFQDKSEKINFSVSCELKKSAKVYLIFESINSLMVEYPATDGNYLFSNVPNGMKVKVLAIGFDGSIPKMAVKETTLSKSLFELDNFKVFTLTELETELEKL